MTEQNHAKGYELRLSASDDGKAPPAGGKQSTPEREADNLSSTDREAGAVARQTEAGEVGTHERRPDPAISTHAQNLGEPVKDDQAVGAARGMTGAESPRTTPIGSPSFSHASSRKRAKGLGVTDDVYAAMLERQGGGCAICGNPPKTRRLHVDHDHKTGQVRGLLCFRCNHHLLARGMTADRLEAGARYLRAHSMTP